MQQRPDSDIYGRGATTQIDLHKGTSAPPVGGWIQDFPAWCSGKGLGAPGPVEYNRSGETETGYRAGLRSFGSVDARLPSARQDDREVRFAGTDKAPDAEAKVGINAAGRQVRVFPVAQMSVAVLVNLPDGCSIDSSLKLSDGRVKVTSPRLELAFSGSPSMDTWGELLTGTADTPLVSCSSTPVRRVVRDDEAAETWWFKRYLEHLWRRYGNGSFCDRLECAKWDEDRPMGALQNREWPGDQASLIRGWGNGGVTYAVNDADGSIGYSSLARARGSGFWLNGSADDRYWLALEQKGIETDQSIWVDPSNDPNQAGRSGANCNAPERDRRYAEVPTGSDPSEGDWTGANSIKSENGADPQSYYTPNEYAICALTFVLAWKDYSTAYERGDNLYGPPTELAADTSNVKDYFEFILTPLSDTTGGQDTVNSNGYAALPSDINTTTLRGDVAEITY